MNNLHREGKQQALADAANDLLLKMECRPMPLEPDGKYTRNETICQPNCEICGGMGIVRLDVPLGHPEFGRIHPCPNMPARLRGTRWHSGLTQQEMDTVNWSVFDSVDVTVTAWHGLPEEKTVKTTADKVAIHIRSYLDNGGWVWVWSPHWGIGKTLMLKAFVADGLRRNIQGAYLRMSELLNDLRQAYDENDPRKPAIDRLARWSMIDRLALDEFDKANLTNWGSEQAFAILDRRYENAAVGLVSTFVASNSPPTDALASRASDGRMLLIKIDGRDVRPAMGRAMQNFMEGL